MRIDNYYLGHLFTYPAAGQAGGGSAPRPAANSGATDERSGHMWSPQLQRIIDLVQQEPEVRSDVVQQVKSRVSQGFYNLPGTAEQTAAAILQAPAP